jgi:hypothetical protein
VNFPGFVLPAASLGLGSLLFRPQRGFLLPTPAGVAGPPELLIPHAVIDEKHSDRLSITQHPVEIGATISDHAFKLPSRFVIRAVWSNSPPTGSLFQQAAGVAAAAAGRKLGTAIGVAASAGVILGAVQTIQSVLSGNAQNQCIEIYQKLLDFQNLRQLCSVFTGKRSYKDVLIEEIAVETRRELENALMVVIDCQQLILVDTQTVTVPMNVSALADPQSNMPTAEAGARSLGPAPNFNASIQPST